MDALARLSTDRADVEIMPDSATPARWSVPVLDTDELRMLGVKRKHEVQFTLRVLERVHGLRHERCFVTGTNALAASYTHIRGMSGPRLRAKYAAYVRSGYDWRSIVKGYVPPSQQPAEFQQFVRGLIEQNPRSAAAQIAKLRDEMWPQGVSIPGYGSWQEWFARTYPSLQVPARFPSLWPAGWTESNLRRYGPSRAERALFTRGMAAAHAHLPKIVRDTSKLRPLELIAVDDFELDVMCVFSGDASRGLKAQIAYVAGMAAQCVGTRKFLARLLGPRVVREERQPDGSIKEIRSGIRAVDIQVLLYDTFRQHGLPEYPVTLLVENATAAISTELELMLGTIYEGRIRVQRTSLIEHRTLTNGYIERGGTPWEKGWIESSFNALWNQLATQPGYKGSNQRLNGPADLDEKLREAARFLGQGEGRASLPAELIERLRLPFRSPAELEAAFDFVVAMRERRTKHRMLGFDTVTEFRWADPRLPAPEGIDPVAPNGFGALAVLSPEQMRLMLPEERKEAICERWERLSAQHPRLALNEQTLALFLLTPKKAVWRNHAVTFVHAKTGYSYIDEDDVMQGTPERTEVLAYVDIARPAAAFVTTLAGKPLGTLRLLGDSPRGVDITDAEAMAEARARRAVVVNRVLAQVRARPLHQEADAAIVADRQHNDAIVAAWKRETAAAPTAIAREIGSQVQDIRTAARQEQRRETALQHADDLDASSLL